jgi:hypothetical protein
MSTWSNTKELWECTGVLLYTDGNRSVEALYWLISNTDLQVCSSHIKGLHRTQSRLPGLVSRQGGGLCFSLYAVSRCLLFSLSVAWCFSLTRHWVKGRGWIALPQSTLHTATSVEWWCPSSLVCARTHTHTHTHTHTWQCLEARLMRRSIHPSTHLPASESFPHSVGCSSGCHRPEQGRQKDVVWHFWLNMSESQKQLLVWTPDSPCNLLLSPSPNPLPLTQYSIPTALMFLGFCFVLFCFVLFCFVRDRVSLCIPGCPGTHSVDQAGLELRNPPASASWVLGLKACATTARLALMFLISESTYKLFDLKLDPLYLRF